jgi:hypothetical protein
MPTTAVMDVSEQISPHHEDPGAGRRDGRHRRRPVAIALAAIALALAAVAGVLGPLGALPSAHAEDGNPTFHLGNDDGSTYVNFINDIRNRVNDGQYNGVPGSGGPQFDVGHTGNWPSNSRACSCTADFFQVDVHMDSNPGYVRLQVRRSDLYIVGWWTPRGWYNYLGNRDNAGPSWVSADREWQTGFGENYTDLERAAGQARAGLRIDRGTINGAVWALYNANDPRGMARGVLMMTQFISEAARFRPLRDEIALRLGPNPQDPLYLPQEYADQENSWDPLSAAFNNLVRQPEGTHDNTPMEGWGRISPFDGRPIRLVLDTAVRYAQYVLLTSLHR